MRCKSCYEVNNQCFFHLSKSMIFNNDADTIKKWIDNLYRKYELSDNRYIFNNGVSSPDSYNFNLLATSVYPKLLSQKGIYKRGDKFVEDITNYVLQISFLTNISNLFTVDVIKTYIKNVKLNIKNIKNISISLFRENHFIYCITKQALSLEDSIKYCFKKTKGKDIHTIINFYRERDRILWSELYHLSSSIVLIIIKAVD
jgi:hypothetical protein